VARISVADDDPGLLEFVRRILEARGHTVTSYKDGEELWQALEMARESELPELIVSDVQMPKRDGITLCRSIRSRWSKAVMPVVLVSVLEAEDDILRGFEAGANDYMVKPYRAPALAAKVAVLLQERELLTPRATPFEGSSDPTPDIWSHEQPEPPFSIDKYDAEYELGKGGMGTVYRARERGTGRAVALKILAPGIARDRSGLARFFRESAALARVDSPRVVRAIDSGMDHGRYFLAMELVQGRSAKARLVAEGPLPPRDVARIGRDIAQALAALDAKGLVHRDLKPSNVVVGEDGRATLVDFGLARSTEDHDLTGTGEAIGPPHYIAPEVLRGAPATAASDLYSLGASLFELLSGRKPYTGVTAVDIYQAQFTGPRATVRAARADVPRPLAEIVDRLLAVNPLERPSMPADVAEELEGAAAELDAAGTG
jgi:CheY-like chemotaxis protein/predicted Ser/Thr protein kinase